MAPRGRNRESRRTGKEGLFEIDNGSIVDDMWLWYRPSSFNASAFTLSVGSALACVPQSQTLYSTKMTACGTEQSAGEEPLTC